MLSVKNSFFLFVLLGLHLAFNSSIASAPNQYLLQKIAQAPQRDSNTKNWLQLLEQPGNNQHYFLANRQGEIYQLSQDTPKKTALLLDLKQLLTNESLIQLTAFTLHPNFSLRDQEGYATFYTAHITHASNNQSKRLSEAAIDQPLKFDSVITEWRLNAAKQVDFLKQREILRIAMPSQENGITQLSFNPYSKSWHDGFGLLYIALSQSPKLANNPLYSGAILRIDPQEVTSGSYSVPHSNPYYSNENIENSLYLFGAGQISQFIWPDKYSNKLLLSHQYQLKGTSMHWLSYGHGGEDWREFSPKDFIYQTKEALLANNILMYRGKNAPALRTKFLLLQKHKEHWQLNSLTYSNSSPEITINQRKKSREVTPTKPQLEWLLQQKELNALQLSLFSDNRDELLFFNEDSGIIYQLFQQNINLDHNNENVKQSSSGSIAFFFAIMFCVLGSYIFYQINRQKNSAKALVRREFSNLTLTEDKLSINLFRRHEKKPEKVILLADIMQCQLLLGDLVIATVNTSLGHGFSDDQEHEVREIFHKEQIAKMVDHRVRRISLVINSRDKSNLVICLYLRKGSDRITKSSYFEVVDSVVDWCWLIALYINSAHTGKRIIKAKVAAESIAKTGHKSHDDSPLHTQAAVIRPATHLEPVQDKTPQQTVEPHLQHDPSTKQNSPSNAHIETDLVNALEKLVKLQQQGFLSVDEFAQAKAKLLDSLNKTE